MFASKRIAPFISSSIDKPKALSLLLHTADISHPAKSWDLHHRWTTSLLEEFFRQVRGEHSRKETKALHRLWRSHKALCFGQFSKSVAGHHLNWCLYTKIKETTIVIVNDVFGSYQCGKLHFHRAFFSLSRLTNGSIVSWQNQMQNINSLTNQCI